MRSQRLKMTCTGEMGQEAQPSSQPFCWLQPGSPGVFSLVGPVPAATFFGGCKMGIVLSALPEASCIYGHWLLGAASTSSVW